MIKLQAECVACLARTALEKAEGERDGARRSEYMRRVCEILAGADPAHDSAPLLDARITRLRREYLGICADFGPVKRTYNALVMGIYGELRARVNASADPLRAALQLSMAGNYIDFNLFSDVRPEDALRLLDEASERALDETELTKLREDLERGGELIFIHDNCGEVALDKLLIETMLGLYPGIQPVSLVRGGPVANDATREDAAQVRLEEVARVLDNGIPDLPGTQLDELSAALRERLERATLIIAKGQGNFESLIGCGLNVYYLFLSKCPHYTAWFGYPHMSGVLTNELRRKPE